MQRFFITNLELTPGSQISLPAELVHQVGRVLRCRPGDRIVLLDGSGDESVVELIDFAAGGVRATVLERRANQAEPATHLTLYQCLLKGEKLELVLQKATELGASAFVPVLSERVVTQGEPAGKSKQERWLRIIREAAEQSGRGSLPALLPQLKWHAALEDARSAGALLLVPWEEAAGRRHLSEAVAAVEPGRPLALFIGPEGGLSANEASQAESAGAELVTLGPRVLRAETAAIAAVSLILLASRAGPPSAG